VIHKELVSVHYFTITGTVSRAVEDKYIPGNLGDKDVTRDEIKYTT